jgi:predicted metalloendopeptidase
MKDLEPRYSESSLVAPLSHTVRPGDGFYHYINQKWLKRTKIPSSLSEFGASEEIEKRNKADLLSLLKRLGKKEPYGIPKNSEDHIRFFSHIWSNSTHSVEEQYIKGIIGQILDCRNQTDMARIFGWLCSANLSALLEITTNVEKHKPFYTRLTISCVSLILPSKYYLKKSMQSDPIWIAYNDYVYTCATELGMPHLLKAIQAEKEIAKIFTMEAKEDDKEYRGSRLEGLYPDFLWSEFMRAAGLTHWRQEKWIIEELKTIRHLLRWICTVDMEKVAAILSLYIVNNYSHFLRPSIKEARFNLFQRKIRGVNENINEQDEYLETLGAVLPDALCLEYSKTGDPAKKEDVEDLVSKIKLSAIDVMSNNHSLSKRTTALTLEKIRRMEVSIGSPKQPDLPKAEYFSDSLIHTMISLRKARGKQELEQVGKTIDHSSLLYACHIVNASYFEDLNHIVIPWGILHEPFYSIKRPLGWNYGGIGATIAHEITHAFDLEGSHYNPQAKYREWWTKKDRNHFKSRTRKIGKFFTKFKHYGVHIDGNKTLSENWADFGGLIISLDALKKEIERLGLSNEERRDAIKTFFVSYAVSWRDQKRKKKVLYNIERSVHSLSEDRVDRIVPHFQDWYDVFGIKEGDALYLPVKDRLKFF